MLPATGVPAAGVPAPAIPGVALRGAASGGNPSCRRYVLRHGGCMSSNRPA